MYVYTEYREGWGRQQYICSVGECCPQSLMRGKQSMQSSLALMAKFVSDLVN